MLGITDNYRMGMSLQDLPKPKNVAGDYQNSKTADEVDPKRIDVLELSSESLANNSLHGRYAETQKENLEAAISIQANIENISQLRL